MGESSASASKKQTPPWAGAFLDEGTSVQKVPFDYDLQKKRAADVLEKLSDSDKIFLCNIDSTRDEKPRRLDINEASTQFAFAMSAVGLKLLPIPEEGEVDDDTGDDDHDKEPGNVSESDYETRVRKRRRRKREEDDDDDDQNRRGKDKIRRRIEGASSTMNQKGESSKN